MNKSFRNLQSSKQRSASSTFISLHFNKADEEQLEFNYTQDEKNSSTKSESPEPTTSIEGKSDILKEFEVLKPLKEQCHEATFDSRDSQLLDKDSKDHESRINKRTRSVDSNLGLFKRSQDGEPWTFIKDIKDRIEKKVDERKIKEIVAKQLIVEEAYTKLTIESNEHLGTPTSESDQSFSLPSPAVEAAEETKDNSQFEDYIEDELKKAKCEIFRTKPSPSPTGFTLQQPPKREKPTDLSNENDLRSTSLQKGSTNLEKDNKFNSYSVLEYYHKAKSYWNGPLIHVAVILIASLLLPAPAWLSGFIAGVFLGAYFVYYLVKPREYPTEIPNIFEISSQHIDVPEVKGEPAIHKGWMNELPPSLSYNPDTYQVSFTRSVYVRLDGSHLRLSYPKSNIPKRAMFNEKNHDVKFVHQIHRNITGASVKVLPIGLARKRLWSKKYPLCLTIRNIKSIDKNDSSSLESSQSVRSSINHRDSPWKSPLRTNENDEIILYLFARTDREKEQWYHRFREATHSKLVRSRSATDISDSAQLAFYSPKKDFCEDDDGFTKLSMSKRQKFELYMSHLTSQHNLSRLFISKDKKEGDQSISNSQCSLQWLNVLIGRVFFDFLAEESWGQLVADRIQKKLSKLKLPAFLTELTIKDINLGTALPKIHRASEPTMDQCGLWIDIDLSYNGSFHMTLETKINLRKYTNASEEGATDAKDAVEQEMKSPVYNSEEEDSAESSSDDGISPTDIISMDDSMVQDRGKRRLQRFVDKVTRSTYFRSAARSRYVRRTVENISNTPLLLTVELRWLAGTLALNVPHRPTDRLWYGFRTNPHLSIVARPKLGQHVVKRTRVTEWIEKKLVSEFQKVLVMPNMDDLIVPIMQLDDDL